MPDIVLAAIARANQDLDQATIDKAMECYTNAVECDTGTGGDVVMGYADGGGLNVWRHVTRMEAILQALPIPTSGEMMFRDAQWNTDPTVAANDIRFLIQAGVTFIIGYPDQGTNIADAILEAKAGRHPVHHVLGRMGGPPRPRRAPSSPDRTTSPWSARTSARWATASPRSSTTASRPAGRPHGRHTGQRAVPRMAAVLQKALNP